MFARRNRFSVAVGFVIAAGLFVIFFLKPDPTYTGSIEVSAASLSAPVAVTPAFLTGVNIQNFSFSPSTVNITAGTTVRWTWVNGTHSTTSGNCCTSDGIWDSGVRTGGGNTFDFTFTTPGTFRYFCQIHGAMMTGTVNVAAAATATISGRVLTQSGRGIKRAVVTLTDQNNAARSVTANQFGFYQFSNVTTGQTYVISVQARRFTFTPQSIPVSGNIANQDLICQTQ